MIEEKSVIKISDAKNVDTDIEYKIITVRIFTEQLNYFRENGRIEEFQDELIKIMTTKIREELVWNLKISVTGFKGSLS